MKVRCVYNSGKALRNFELDVFLKDEIRGRFGATGFSEYNELEIGKDYSVMGIIIFETYQGYLIDSDGFISVCPTLLFQTLDNEIPNNWYFRSVGKDEDIYPFIQTIFGYYELCNDINTYENLIVEKDYEYQQIYFKRKLELYKE